MKAWYFNPEFRIVSTLYYCHKISGRYLRSYLWARWLWRNLIIKNGCYIDPNVKIGQGLCLPHPIGIVIDGDCVIGDNVVILKCYHRPKDVGSQGGGADW